MDIGILAVAEFSLCESYKWSREYGIVDLLLIKRNTRDVYSLEPLLDLCLSSFAFIDEELGVEDLRLLVACDAIEVLLHLVLILHGKFSGHITPNTRDSLLPVENFISVVIRLHEVNNPERVSFKDGFYHGDVSLSVGIDIVTLILRLDRKLAG